MLGSGDERTAVGCCTTH